ncbi:MAG: hypothetical protein V2I33_21840 [Kangiellaceae bacterium]|nr:hypothetical protein [Kangiellaceae bacterium]
MESSRKGNYTAPGGKTVVILIDDINMPEPDVSNAQPPIELLRQLIDSGFVYDRKFFRKI